LPENTTRYGETYPKSDLFNKARYAPEMEKRLRWYWRNPSDLCPWHMDETYVKVNGRWAYLDTGPSTAGAALSIFISPPVVTAKLHTGFW
jgi:IS6 family transposase